MAAKNRNFSRPAANLATYRYNYDVNMDKQLLWHLYVA